MSEPVAGVKDAPGLTHAFSVGEIDGAKTYIARRYNEPSNGSFKESLTRSLAAQGLGAEEGQKPHYIIDAHIDYDTPSMVGPWDEATIKLDVAYTVSAIENHKMIWHDTIHSSATEPPLNDGNVLLGLLLTAPQQAQERIRNVTDRTTKDNLEQFCQRLPTVLPPPASQ